MENNCQLLRVLLKLLESSRDATTLAVGCNDLSQFVGHVSHGAPAPPLRRRRPRAWLPTAGGGLLFCALCGQQAADRRPPAAGVQPKPARRPCPLPPQAAAS